MLSEIGREVFKYTPKFVIVDSTFASINNNWHPVASDLDPKSEDFDQILSTKWIKVADNVFID
jgi:predicted enzyme involved in methoxymalonyl-ACP biosynthesis